MRTLEEYAEENGNIGVFRKRLVHVRAFKTNKKIEILTLEGTMTASVGDYIIEGINRECYPCKPNIFEKTYDPVIIERKEKQ